MSRACPLLYKLYSSSTRNLSDKQKRSLVIRKHQDSTIKTKALRDALKLRCPWAVAMLPKQKLSGGMRKHKRKSTKHRSKKTQMRKSNKKRRSRH